MSERKRGPILIGYTPFKDEDPSEDGSERKEEVSQTIRLTLLRNENEIPNLHLGELKALYPDATFEEPGQESKGPLLRVFLEIKRSHEPRLAAVRMRSKLEDLDHLHCEIYEDLKLAD